MARQEASWDLSPDGVTVSVLHTGRHYPDDLADTAILYHYPRTQRAPSQDQGEIRATKAARALGLPVFVITELEDDPQLRDVHLGWVTASDCAFGGRRQHSRRSVPTHSSSKPPSVHWLR